MKYFRFWTQKSFVIKIGKQDQAINLLVGSNVSKEAALSEAVVRARTIENRINDGTARQEYDAAIKEHVLEVLDESNIVTVCRYGAKILNTTQYTILDLDNYPIDWLDLFKLWRKFSKKERIVKKFEQRIDRLPELGKDFRIYETTQGIRIIGKKYLDPASENFTAMMRTLYVDWVYVQLSKKQMCYRARLTPKPYRIQMQPIRIKTPLDCESDAFHAWYEKYHQTSLAFSVVKLIKTIGEDFSFEPVVRFHDQTCRANAGNKLA